MGTYKLPLSENTPKQVYLSRRAFMHAAGLAAGGLLLAACAPIDQSGGQN